MNNEQKKFWEHYNLESSKPPSEDFNKRIMIYIRELAGKTDIENPKDVVSSLKIFYTWVSVALGK